MTSEQYKELLLTTLSQLRYVRGIPVEGSYPQQYDTDLPIVHITSIQDIQNIGTAYPSSCYFSLVQDIDAEGFDYRPVNIVEGHFNGNGYKISNLCIQQINNPEYEDIFGALFRTVSLSTVENVTLDNLDATALFASGIVAKAMNSTFLNCQASGKMLGAWAGGIASQALRTNIVNCSTNLDATAGVFSGIVTQGQDVFIQGCSFNGIVLSEQASGIMSEDLGNSQIKQSFNLGEFSVYDSTELTYVAGILGQGISTSVTDCFSRPIFHPGFDNTSGLVGRLNDGEIKRSYTTVPDTILDGTNNVIDYVYTEDLKDCATFANYDLENVWLCNDGYYLEIRPITDPDLPEQVFTEIHNYNDLVNISPSGAYILMEDIDLTGVEFTPIDLTTGYFNGNNHSISNLTINDATSDHIGLFSRAAMISNLTLSGEAHGRDYVGLIVGEMTLGSETMINCSASGIATGRNYVGGSLGSGKNIAASHFDGNVSASGEQVGGFAGFCTEVTKCSSVADVIGGDSVGGFMGGGTATKSSSIGNTTGFNKVGGFAGGTSWLLDCFSRGSTDGNAQVGGMVGRYAGFIVTTIKRCYCDGAVSGNEDVHAFVGKKILFSGDITDCYYNSLTAGVSDNYASGLPSLLCPNAFNWDYVNVWECVDGEYPTIREYPTIIAETSELPFDITMNIRVLDVDYPGYLINEWVKSRDIFVYEDVYTRKLVISKHNYSYPILNVPTDISAWGSQQFYRFPELKEGWEWRGGRAVNLVHLELVRLYSEINLLKQKEADYVQKIELAEGGTDNLEADLALTRNAITDLVGQFTALYLNESLKLPSEDQMYLNIIS